jgi:hypothetical protein
LFRERGRGEREREREREREMWKGTYAVRFLGRKMTFPQRQSVGTFRSSHPRKS